MTTSSDSARTPPRVGVTVASTGADCGAALSAAVYALGKHLDTLVIYEKLGGKAGTQQHLHGQSNTGANPAAEAVGLLEREIAARPKLGLCDRVTSVSKAEGGFQITT